jgi:2,5-diketo-D-gluconate reductase A
MNKDSNVSLKSGREMPILGMGSWQLTDPADAVINAISIGYHMIDTSSDYGSQPGIGEGIEKSGVFRDKLFIVTKVEETDDSYERTKSNLKELRLDFVDLMLIHRPPEDGSAGIELWNGLIKAQKEGLIRDIGVSNYPTELIDQLVQLGGVVPVVNQIEWSPFGFSPKMKKYCQENQIVIQAYSPLTRAERLDDKILVAIAEKYHKTPAQILIRWNLQQGTVPIIKAQSKDHQQQNLEVFDFEITSEDMEKLNSLNEEFSALGSVPKYMEVESSFPVNH